MPESLGAQVLHAVWVAARIAAAAYVGLCAVLYLRQSAMLFHPTREIEDTPASAGLPFEDVRLRTEDGETLGAWFIPSDAARATLLMCHGNGGNIGHRIDAIRFFHGLGLNVLAFDYRGYGTSTGAPSETGLHADAQAAWRHLVSGRGIAAGRIIVFGRSLGGAVAARLAREARPAGLIIEAAFTSVPDMGASLYPFLPVRLLCRYRLATIDDIRELACPLLLAHSPQDDLIPYRQGLALFEAARPPKRMVQLSGGHNDGESVFTDAYRRELDTFIGEVAHSPAAGRP